MLKFVRFLAVYFCFVVSLAYADTIAVPSSEARLWASDKGQELLTALSEPNTIEKYAKLDQMMTEDVNLDYVSKFVIGKYARLMNQEQKQRYTDLFYRYVLSLYKGTSFNFEPHNINFSIDNVTEHNKFTTVTCLVDPGQLSKDVKLERIPVKFKLIRGEQNRIQAVDVEISDVSMVIEYRKRFYQMILREDENIEWFLDTFEDKVKANEAAISSVSTI